MTCDRGLSEEEIGTQVVWSQNWSMGRRVYLIGSERERKDEKKKKIVWQGVTSKVLQ